eukprot:gene4964-6325_t
MPLLQRHPTKTFEDKNIPKDKISNSAYSTQQPAYPDTNASNRSRVLLGDEISRKQRVLDSLPLITSFVFAVHASLPYNDRALDTDSISDEGAWLANIGVKALPIIATLLECPPIAQVLAMYPSRQDTLMLKYSVASFITRLSWNNDNKAMIYQT